MHYFREVRRINIHAYGDLPASTRCNLKKFVVRLDVLTFRCREIKRNFFGSMLHPLSLKKQSIDIHRDFAPYVLPKIPRLKVGMCYTDVRGNKRNGLYGINMLAPRIL